jgi:hypothetical protein
MKRSSIAALSSATNHAGTCIGGDADACHCALQSYAWDTETTGFGVVVGRTGIKTFVARATVGGKKRRVKIGVAGAPMPGGDGFTWNVERVRKAANQVLGRMAAGEDPNAGKRAASTPVATSDRGPTLREAIAMHSVADMIALPMVALGGDEADAMIEFTSTEIRCGGSQPLVTRQSSEGRLNGEEERGSQLAPVAAGHGRPLHRSHVSRQRSDVSAVRGRGVAVGTARARIQGLPDDQQGDRR